LTFNNFTTTDNWVRVSIIFPTAAYVSDVRDE
jgi:hypothetical protein